MTQEQFADRPPSIDEFTAQAYLAGAKILPRELAQSVMDVGDIGSLADPEHVSRLVSRLDANNADPYQTVLQLSCSSEAMATLLAADVGVKEGYRLHEHTQAVLSRFEGVQSRFAPDECKILRTALLLQDIGKPLAVALDGTNAGQSSYNQKVAANILSAVNPLVLDSSEKQLVELLIGHDIIGSAIQGKVLLDEAKMQLAALHDACPERYRDRLMAYVKAMYMCDATAYTSHASYRNAEGDHEYQAKRSLNFLFRRGDLGLDFRFVTHKRIFESLTNTTESRAGNLAVRETVGTRQEAKADPTVVTKLLGGVETKAEFDIERLVYDERFGGLVVPEEGGLIRLMMFRADIHGSYSPAKVGDLVNRPQEGRRIRNSLYGTGLYTGNTAESVAFFGWQPDRSISVYLSPPFKQGEMLDLRDHTTRRVVTQRQIGSFITRGVAMRAFGKHTTLNSIDAGYGDSKAVAMDMGVDSYLAQRLLGKPHDHHIRPTWYIWRDPEAELEKVGTVSSFVLPGRAHRLVRAIQPKAK